MAQWYQWADSNRHALWATDFESVVSTISPHWLGGGIVMVSSLKYRESKRKLFLVDMVSLLL